MDERLKDVIRPQFDYEESICEMKLIRKLTTRYGVSRADKLAWEKIRCLSIVRTSEQHGLLSNISNELTKGCYVDPTGAWVLLADDHDEKFQSYIDRCPAELEYLFVGTTKLTALTIPVFKSIRELYLVANQQLQEIHGLSALNSLESMRIRHGRIRTLTLPAADGLRILYLYNLWNLEEMNGLSNLSGLEDLTIRGTSLNTLSVASNKMLRELSLYRNYHLKEIQGLSELTLLEYLDLSGTKITDTLNLSPYPGLRGLDISNSSFCGIQLDRKLEKLEYLDLRVAKFSGMDFLSNCPSVRELKLSGCSLRRIPEEIRQMKNLHTLLMCFMTLDELPDWLPELGLTIGTDYNAGIDLKCTTVEGVDMSIFERSQEMILEWFQAQREAKTGKPLNEIKVVFLGDGSTGKSLSVARLLADGAMPADFDGEATPGIAIEDRSYELPDGRNVQVHFWDFGGQEILHCMHRIFLSDRTLYVVMINARNNTQDDQARYWLHNVSSFAPDCPVLLVLNQIDQNPNASINERSLKKLYPNLQQIIRLSALTFDQETFNQSLTQPMLEQIAGFKSLGTIFPPAWKMVMDKIRAMDGNYIRGDEYNQICKDSGVDSQTLRLELLKWFNDIGVSFCCEKSTRLRDYVVLKPQWITNAIYTIIWNKRSDTANGMVDRDEIYRLLSASEDTVKQVRTDMTYKLEDVNYVLSITRQFRLSFPMDNGMEFLPMLCKANALPEADDFLEDPAVLEFRMEYDYLPHNVLHRLMVDMRRDLICDKVWFTGALLRQQYNKIDALVKSEGNVLSIYIKAGDAAHTAHTYLNTLRETLDAIHRDMGLKAPQTLVAYKLDDQTEYFPYDMVEGSRQNNVEAIYSTKFRRMIPIEDILNGTDSQVAQQKKKLVKDLTKACAQLQQNHMMYDTSEDNRNDTLRDALSNMDYYVLDQTHTGTGALGKRAGSLDLQLRYPDGSVWTNLEALNLKSDSDSQMKYWDKHLNKLMINYNGAGLPSLFLISYVNCDANRFNGICESYREHIRSYKHENFVFRSESLTDVPLRDGQYAWLRVLRGTYDLDGTPVTVYHYFVGFTKGTRGSEEFDD